MAGVVVAASGCGARVADPPSLAASGTPTVSTTSAVPTTGAVPTTAAVPATPAAPTTSSASPSPAGSDVFALPGLATSHDADPGLWLSWSLLDVSGDRRVGSPDSTTGRTNAESSIKVWIATDYVRVAQGRTLSSSERSDIDRAVRDSDDNAAERLYRRIGDDAVLRHLDTVCDVDIRTARRGYWSYAQITAVDATRILHCALRRLPAYRGGSEVLDDLREVSADGAFGIKDGLPPGTDVQLKNGWTEHSATGLWNVDCVGAWSHFVLAVLTRYPAGKGLDYGAGVCRDITAELVDRLGHR